MRVIGLIRLRIRITGYYLMLKFAFDVSLDWISSWIYQTVTFSYLISGNKLICRNDITCGHLQADVICRLKIAWHKFLSSFLIKFQESYNMRHRHIFLSRVWKFYSLRKAMLRSLITGSHFSQRCAKYARLGTNKIMWNSLKYPTVD